MRHMLVIGCFLSLWISPIFAQSDAPALPRTPTLDDAAAYLRYHLGEPPIGFTSYFWFDDQTPALIYADLDGDGDDDLVAQGWLFVAVMLWEDDSYSVPLQIIETQSIGSGAWSQVQLTDWTLDGITDVVFDTRLPLTQSGAYGYQFERRIISCALLCAVAWEGPTALYAEIDTAQDQGVYLYQTELHITHNPEERVMLSVLSTDFAFACRMQICQVTEETFAPDTYYPPARIGAQVETSFVWDGIEFLQTDRTTLVGASVMRARPQHIATSPAGIRADMTFDSLSNQCVVSVEAITADTFACVPDFVRLQWSQIEDSAVLLVEYPAYNTETLVIYDIAGNELGRVSGFIRDPIWLGVRVEEDSVIVANERYTAECPQDLCWFTLSDRLTTTSLAEIVAAP